MGYWGDVGRNIWQTLEDLTRKWKHRCWMLTVGVGATWQIYRLK
jgi:hypothetical protein